MSNSSATVPTLLFSAVLVLAPATLSRAQMANVTIRRFEDAPVTGTIESIDRQGRIVGAGLPDRFHLRDVVEIVTAHPAHPSHPSHPSQKQPESGVLIQLVGGGEIRGHSPTISHETFRFESASGIEGIEGTEGAEGIAMQALRAIVWKTSPLIAGQLAAPSTDDDMVFVETSDGERRLAGIVENLTDQQLQIRYKNKSRKIGVGKINAIVMADLGLEPSSGSLATIRMTDGSIVMGKLQTLSQHTLTVGLPGGLGLSLNIDRIANVQIQSDRLVYLSDLSPTTVQQATDFTVQRSWQPDRSVERKPISIRGENAGETVEFAKGIGTQAFSQLDYSNEGHFEHFLATVGIASETQGRGDCQMVVRGDGIELWSARVRGTDPPAKVEVDIRGMETISLTVYPGEDFDLADHANWANARFTK